MQFATVLAAIAVASGGTANEPLMPSSSWVVDAGAAHCIAYRQFGPAEAPVTLTAKMPAMGNIVQIGIFRAARGKDEFAEQVDGRWGLDGVPLQRISVLRYRGKNGKHDIAIFNLSKDAVRSAAQLGSPTMRFSAAQMDVRLRLAGLGKVMPVLDDCVRDLRTYWNIPAERADTAARVDAVFVKPKAQGPELAEDGGRRASGKLRNLFNSDDFPAQALQGHQGGQTGMVLLIDETGRVADCTVTETSKVAVLDAQSCAIVQERARYTPGTDASGKPRRDSDVARILWTF